jgi:hypothetical protein
MRREATLSTHPMSSRAAQPDPSAACLFDLLWESLADVLGTAATATVLRRALQQVASNGAGPTPEVVIERKNLEYHYRVPESWQLPGDEASHQTLRALGRALGALLTELTGPVLVRRLERLAPFQERGIVFNSFNRKDAA